MVSYIVVHIVPVTAWAALSYRRKKAWHYQVTVSGKTMPLKPVEPSSGSIEVVFVGSERYAHDSGALFSLLLDLWVKHPDAKILYADELHNNALSQRMVTATRWLMQHMPRWLQRRLPKYSNLFTLRAMLSLIY
jgi:hypothetical protein